jgi:pimeloyl-ACP methyl ester carboxylesterase
MRRAVLVGTRHLTYLEAGAGDARVLVLLHAFPLTADMWQAQLEVPPDGWRMLAPDFAGLGGSDDHTRESVSLDDYATDVLAWLDRLGIERVVLAGLSMGGYVALAIARLAPQRLSGIILAYTKASPDSADARAGRGRMLDILSERGAHGVADEMIPKLLGPTTRETHPVLATDVRSLVLSNDPEGLRRAILRLRDRRDATPLLGEIRVPALVIVGEEDVVTPPSDAQALQAAIPAATYEAIPRAGHLTNLESPAAFNASLQKFLSTL